MRDYFVIGPVPAGEPCVQVGHPEYRQKAIAECNRFIKQLKKEFGEPPAGAELRTKAFNHDFGQYLEVVCYYNEGNEDAVGYCAELEADTPEYWKD